MSDDCVRANEILSMKGASAWLTTLPLQSEKFALNKREFFEPHLTPVTGENLPRSSNTGDDACLNVSARGFWQRGQRAFFDVRVFNPFAPSHLKQNLQKVFAANEKEEKRQYNSRVIEVEHGSFTPLVFSAYGGSSPETERFIAELSVKLATKHDQELSVVTNWLRTKLSFTILRSAILSIRGSHTVRKNEVITDPAEIEISKAVGQIL